MKSVKIPATSAWARIRAQVTRKRTYPEEAMTLVGRTLGLICFFCLTAGRLSATELSNDIEILPLENTINYFDLTGHGEHDIVIRAFWDLGYDSAIFYDTFLSDMVFDSEENVSQGAPTQIKIIGIEPEKREQFVDRVQEVYKGNCPYKTVIIYKRSGPRTFHDQDVIGVRTNHNIEAMDRYLNVFLITAHLDERDNLNGNTKVNFEKYQLFDYGVTHRGVSRFVFEYIERSSSYVNFGKYCNGPDIFYGPAADPIREFINK